MSEELIKRLRERECINAAAGATVDACVMREAIAALESRPAPAVQVPEGLPKLTRPQLEALAAKWGYSLDEAHDYYELLREVLAAAPAPATVATGSEVNTCDLNPLPVGSGHMQVAMQAASSAPATVATEAVAQECDCGAMEYCNICAPIREKPVAQSGGVDVEKVMALVEEYAAAVSNADDNMHHGNSKYQADFNTVRDALYHQLRALLSAPPAASGCDYHAVAQFLYGLLDDIDTASDMAKSDNAVYRKLVESIQARKREAVAECDGYTVIFKTPAIANQEPKP